MTPIVHLLGNPEPVDEIAEILEHIYAEFQYSSQGDQQYGSPLKEVEGAPPDLEPLLLEAENAVKNHTH